MTCALRPRCRGRLARRLVAKIDSIKLQEQAAHSKPWIAVAAVAITTGAALFGISTEAQAACSNPVGQPGVLPPQYFNWGPSAVCAGASAGTSITTALTTLDIAFLSQTTAFVGVPDNSIPNQPGGGIWIRGVGGENTVSSTSVAVGSPPAGGAVGADSRSRIDYGGFQAGADLGRFNIGASGLNFVIGITGGELTANDRELSGIGTYNFNAPFVGGYAVLTKGNFFIDAEVRGDFYGITASNSNVGLASGSFGGKAISVTSSAGYKFDIGSYFIEPSVALIWSRLNLGTLAFPGGGPFGVPSGFYSFDPIDSLIGRAGIRVGTSFQSNNLVLQPFFAASIWNEFAGDVTSAYNCAPVSNCGFSTLNIDTARIGTFGQFGLGITGAVSNTGWLGYVRADYRTGENIEGWSVVGGLRYQFSLDTSGPKLITK
jgi:outer membrane autotransporter protein